jgi:hypothetical protein
MTVFTGSVPATPALLNSACTGPLIRVDGGVDGSFAAQIGLDEGARRPDGSFRSITVM